MRKKKVILGFAVAVVAALCITAALTLLSRQKAASPEPTQPQKTETVTAPDKSPTLDLAKVWQLVNEERAKTGLPGLVRDPLLDKSAQEKCNDMVARDYWSHVPPGGGTTWDSVKSYNRYTTAGENLAYGFTSESGVVEGWMKSEGHKANILRPDFTNVGYAQCEYPKQSKRGEATVLVQHFADNPTGAN
jgi:uncharacterized protein YkwD